MTFWFAMAGRNCNLVFFKKEVKKHAEKHQKFDFMGNFVGDIIAWCHIYWYVRECSGFIFGISKSGMVVDWRGDRVVGMEKRRETVGRKCVYSFEKSF